MRPRGCLQASRHDQHIVDLGLPETRRTQHPVDVVEVGVPARRDVRHRDVPGGANGRGGGARLSGSAPEAR